MKRCVLLLVFLAGCGATTPGVKYGEVNDASDPVLQHLAIDVTAAKPAGGPLSVTVRVSDPDRHANNGQGCELGLKGYRVSMDGVPVGDLGEGTAEKGTQISGATIGESNCVPASLVWKFPDNYVPKDKSKITIEHSGRDATVQIDELTTGRQAHGTIRECEGVIKCSTTSTIAATP